MALKNLESLQHVIANSTHNIANTLIEIKDTTKAKKIELAVLFTVVSFNVNWNYIKYLKITILVIVSKTPPISLNVLLNVSTFWAAEDKASLISFW